MLFPKIRLLGTGIFLFLLASPRTGHTQRHIIFVSPNSQMNILPGATIHLDGLRMEPDSLFILKSGQSVLVHDSVINKTTHVPIARSYQFTGGTVPFSGNIHFDYQDSHLKGADEAALQLMAHNGNKWMQFKKTATNRENSINSQGIRKLSIHELTLTHLPQLLDYSWGVRTAYRKNRQQKVEWEVITPADIDHFKIERSTDLASWTLINDSVPARNTGRLQAYQQTDTQYLPAKLYYRITEVNQQGAAALSMAIPLPAESQNLDYLVYPNPVTNFFFIKGDVLNLRQIDLYNSAGALVKRWNAKQAIYFIPIQSSGVYTLRITDAAGRHLSTQIIKQ